MSGAPRPEGPLTSSVERLRHELDRWLDAAWSQGERAMDAMGLRSGRPWSPPIEIFEGPESVRVLVDLPGVPADRINLTLVGHMLTISGTLHTAACGENEQRHGGERPTGEFRRSIPLPASVDPDKISAVSRDGLLTVTLGKAETEKSRQIPVKCEPPPAPTNPVM